MNPALSAVFACFAMFVGRSFLDIRPAGFSNLLVAVFLLTLVLATYRNILYIWLIVPLSVLWFPSSVIRRPWPAIASAKAAVLWGRHWPFFPGYFRGVFAT